MPFEQTGFAEEFLNNLATSESAREFRNTDIIYSQSDVADCSYYIRSGQVQLSVFSAAGKQAVIGILRERQFFGMECLLPGRPRRLATAASSGRVRLARIFKDKILQLLHNDAAFMDLFITNLALRVCRVEEDLVDRLFNSSEKRLARALLLLAQSYGQNAPQALVPKMSHETLAQMVGASRSRVSSFLNKFRRLGLIDYRRNSLLIRGSLLNDSPTSCAPLCAADIKVSRPHQQQRR